MNNKPDLSSLVGRELQVLNVNRWGSTLVFTEKEPTIEIGFDADFSFTDTDGQTSYVEDMRIGGGLLSLLLGFSIENASWEDERKLTLSFSSGARIEIPHTEYIEIDGTPAIPGDQVIRSKK